MKIEMVQINDLKPAEYNPRKHDDELIKKLVNGIKAISEETAKNSGAQTGDEIEIICAEPIIINADNTVISGHQRLKALTQLGAETAPCVRINVDKDREKAFNIAFNKISGSWEDDMLKELLTDLSGIGLDELTGFDAEEIEGLLDTPFSGKTDEDAVPEPLKEATAKRGEIYQLGEHRVMCGDSTDPNDVEKLMDGKKADMVFTDPPYNIDYGVSKNPRHKIRSIENDSMSTDEWSIFCHKLYDIFKIYNTGDIYMWGASGPEGMRMRLWLTEMGCHWSATIVWKKQQLVLSPAKYQRMYEPCFYGWFDKSSFVADRKQVEVWEINRPLNSKLHPTMKPVELCEKGIINSSNKENMVMDLFLGSGSTLIACEKTGRKCYGMEIDPIYVDVIIKRWEDFTGKKAELL